MKEKYVFIMKVEINVRFVFREVLFVYFDGGDFVVCIFNLIVIFFLNICELFDWDFRKNLVGKSVKDVEVLKDLRCIFIIVLIFRDIVLDFVGISIFVSEVFFLNSSYDFEICMCYYYIEGIMMN